MLLLSECDLKLCVLVADLDHACTLVTLGVNILNMLSAQEEKKRARGAAHIDHRLHTQHVLHLIGHALDLSANTDVHHAH